MVDGVRIDELPAETTPNFQAVFPVMLGGVTKYMTVDQVGDLILDVILDGAPASLDTLNELAAALADDANFSATILAAIALKAPLASPALTGNPTAPTQAPGDNSTKISTTAYVKAAIDVVLGGVSAAFDTLAELAAALALKWDATVVHALTGKTTPVDADEFVIIDTAAANVGKKLTWANVKATLVTAFATVFAPILGNGSVSTTTLASTHLIATALATDDKEIVIDFAGFQLVTNGQNAVVQIGVAGTLVTTGYNGSGSRLAASVMATLPSTIGCLMYTAANTEVSSGEIICRLVDVASNLWRIRINAGCGQTAIFVSEAYIALAGVPERIAITATSGNITAGAKFNTRQRK